MLFSVSKLESVWRVRPNGVLHVGAHKAEEWPQYEAQSWLPIIWVEGQEDLVVELKKKLPSKFNSVIQAFVWSETGIKKKFNIANNGQSSSLLQFGSHAIDYPEIHFEKNIEIDTVRLDDVLDKDSFFDFVNIDLQGIELEALKGLSHFTPTVNWIYSEVNRREVYKGCTLVRDLDEYLRKLGFERVATRWCLGTGWGDALYAKGNRRSRFTNLRALSSQLIWYTPEVLRYIRRHMSRIKHRNG
jgi:FkbM family methyltransferase